MSNKRENLAHLSHTMIILTMLPFDDEKIASYNLGYRYDAETKTHSFHDHAGERVYYKLIANSDSAYAATRKYSMGYGFGDDAQAYIQVDASGKVLEVNGKPNVVVAFPGLNSVPSRKDPTINAFLRDSALALHDLQSGTSFDQRFFNRFMKQELLPALEKYGVSPSDVQVTSHSMGDRNAMEYLARYGAKGLAIDSWDRADALVGAASAAVVRKTGLKDPAAPAFQQALIKEMSAITARLTALDGDKHATINHVRDYTQITSERYNVSGGGHRGSNFMNLDPEKIEPAQSKANLKTLAQDVSNIRSLFENRLNNARIAPDTPTNYANHPFSPKPITIDR